MPKRLRRTEFEASWDTTTHGKKVVQTFKTEPLARHYAHGIALNKGDGESTLHHNGRVQVKEIEIHELDIGSYTHNGVVESFTQPRQGLINQDED